MTGSIVMMVIGSVLLLPMAFLVMLAFFHLIGDILQGLFDTKEDIVITLIILFMSCIGGAFLWIGIATLPK